MKYKKRILIAAFVPALIILFSTESFSQRENRRRIRENINALRLIRMTQVLDLSEEQAVKIYAFINRQEKEKMEVQRKIGGILRELRREVRKENPDENRIRESLNRMKKVRIILKSKDEETGHFLQENLTLVQLAKYHLFIIDFNRGLLDKLDRARNMRKRVPARR